MVLVSLFYHHREEMSLSFWFPFGICSFIVKQAKREFKYFFDFAAFLKGDLSDADLLFCDGIKHLSDTQGLNLTDARLTSELCEKFGIAYLTYEADEELLQTFPQTEAN